MRESNFRSVPSNRAAVSITSSLYDRRALDCSADRPLINSLYHLSVLASTSARVRDTLCVDGGLERIVAILKQCTECDNNNSNNNNINDDNINDYDNKNTLIAWKWILALQCLVYLGTRGTESVRQRVVEAGAVPVITTILDNYLQTMEKIKLEQQTQEQKTKWHLEMTQQMVTTTNAGRARRTMGTGAVSLGGDLPRGAAQQRPATGNFNVTATYQAPAGIINDNSSVVSSVTSSIMSSVVSTATGATDIGEASSRSFTTNSSNSQQQQQEENVAYNANSTRMSASALGGSFASALLQASAVAAARQPPSLNNTNNSNTINDNSSTNHHNLASGLSFNRVHLHSQASNAVYHTHAQGTTLMDSTDEDMTRHESVTNNNDNEHAMHSVSNRSETTNLVDRSTTNDVVTRVTPIARARESETQIANMDDNDSTEEWAVRVTQGEQANNNVAGTGQEAVSQNQQNLTSSGNTANIMVRSFYNNVIVPRDEDIVWSLEILAFVSKYAYLRETLQASHLVPQLSMRDPYREPLLRTEFSKFFRGHSCSGHDDCEDEDVDMEICHDSWNMPAALVRTTNWSYDKYDFESEHDTDPEYLGDTINVFPLVEKFALKNFSRDIQYWAGVIMRNSCRKNEFKGGIRQCANFECGKWEDYPRQFAKCRRCKRTKYCSKDCQLSAWEYHRHWCVASTSSSSSNASTSSTTSTSQTSGSNQQRLVAARSGGNSSSDVPVQVAPSASQRAASTRTSSSPTSQPRQSDGDI